MKRTLNSPVKFALLSAAIVGLSTLTHAADISWQTPLNISGASDVSTAGTFFGSWAPGNDWGGSDYADLFPVNGVTFQAYGTAGLNFNFSGAGINMDRYNGFADPNTADANYNHLLHTAMFNWNAGSSSMTVNWENLTIGNTYLVQAWLNDGRSGQSGTSTFTGGVNTSGPVAIGDGAPGQYITGTFLADGTAQSFTMSPGIMLNLVQVRDITSVPEPSVLALAGIGVAALIGSRRKFSV
jgi:PEP-CTERM motif